jgi:hypothetical protein
MERNNPEALQQAKQRDQKLDSEYLSLMAELGENVDASRSNEPGVKVVRINIIMSTIGDLIWTLLINLKF